MYYNNINQIPNNEDRQFFVPFLLGGLAGAGIVGISRPRPVYVNSPNQTPYPYPQYTPYQTPYRPPYSYYNYSSGSYY